MTSDTMTPARPAVTLDLWLTLIAEPDGTSRSQKRFETRAELTREVLERHGVSVPFDRLVEASQEISLMVTSDHDLGVDLEFQDRVAQMLSLVDPELPGQIGVSGVAAVADAVDEAFLASPPSFINGAKEVLTRLRELDLKLALISNTGLTSPAAYRRWFAAEDVLSQFDELTFSNEIACAKPNPNIFCPTLEKLGARPEQALHIGDNLLTDISGAAGVGMMTGWISGYDDREPMVQPDYTLASITDLPAVVSRWLEQGPTITT